MSSYNPLQSFSGLNSGMILKDQYEIVELRGQGAFGTLYKAIDSSLDEPRVVAIKHIHPMVAGDARSLKNIKREVGLAREINHPNIVSVWSLEQWRDLTFIVMQYIDGVNLGDLLAEQDNDKFSLDQTLIYLRDIAEGLDYLHTLSKPIIHRDLKPSNILWDKNEKRLLISDFGLAREIKNSMSRLSMDATSGSPPYMAPEIWNNDDPSIASDIYALGVMTYEMLSGKLPFKGPDFSHQHRNIEAKPVESIPEDVNTALMLCLRKDKTNRFTNANAIIEALQSSLIKIESIVCPLCGQNKDTERFTCPDCNKANFCLEHKTYEGLCINCEQIRQAIEEKKLEQERIDLEKRKQEEHHKLEEKRKKPIEKERMRKEQLKATENDEEEVVQHKQNMKTSWLYAGLIIALTVVIFFMLKLYFKNSVSIQFSKTFNDWAVAHSVVQVNDGGYVFAGYDDDWILTRDMLLEKTDAIGKREWQQTLSGTEAKEVEQTKDGGFILVGYAYPGGMYLVKTDAIGNIEWSNLYGGIVANAIEQTNDGGYILIGEARPKGKSVTDIVIVKTDGFGNKEWDRTFGGTDPEEAIGIEQASDGGYILAWNTSIDTWLIKTNASGIKKWDQTFGGVGHDFGQTNDGGYMLVGSNYSFGDRDVWLLKTDNSGIKEWDQTFGGLDHDVAYAFDQTNDGGYIIVGSTRSYRRGECMWLIKANANGIKEWDQTFCGAQYAEALDVKQTADSSYIIVGHNHWSISGYDTWLLKVK